MPAKRARSICFTHNNYVEGDDEKIKNAFPNAYGIIGKEVGESGTPHLQGYLKLERQTSLKKITDELARVLGRRPHVEKTQGTPQQNIEYCSKEGNFIEWGDRPKMGKRMDLEAAYDDARSDMKMVEVADRHKSAFLRYHRGIEKVRELHNAEQAEAWRDVEVIIHTGPTGCGKTRAAMTVDEGERTPYKIQGAGLQWWDGYEGEPVIVIDEYSNNIPIDKLLALLDGYKLRLPVKGGFTYARWKTVHITTNLTREQFHEQAKEEHKAALERRVTHWRSYWGVRDNPWTASKRSRSAMEEEDAFMAEYMAQPRDSFEWAEYEQKRARLNEDFTF